MFNLIRKDIIIQKWQFLFCILYGLFFIFGNFSDNKQCIMYIPTMVFISIITPFAYDDKYKSDYIMNSIPVTRRDIVISKYISVIAYFLIGTINIMVLEKITYFITSSNIDFVTINNIKLSIMVTMTMCSVYLPLLIKFGYTKARFIFIISYFAVFTTIINITIYKFNLLTARSTFLDDLFLYNILGVVVTLIIFILSMVISIKIYNKKDLC